ncbi:VWA domain-containing protein [Gordonia sp. NPDC003376]
MAALLTGLLAGVPAPPAAAAPSSNAVKPLVIVFDLSGSMNETDGAGVVKLDGAKDAMIDLVNGQPRGAEIGLWTYPGDGSCDAGGFVPGADVRRVDDPAALSATIRDLSADGGTPTADALKNVAKDMRDRGRTGATMVLVSDGESNCGDDPCDTAKELAGSGFDITISGVGFQISDGGAEELQCIAAATQGQYYTADDSAALGERLSALTVPSLGVDVTAGSVAPSGGQTEISVEVRNSGSTRIPNAWVGLQFNRGEDGSGILPAVIPPRFALGALGSGEHQKRSWLVSTGPAGNSGALNWSVSAWGETTFPEVERGSIVVSKDIDPSRGGQVLKDILASPASAIVMGDSYSSGEGTGNYLPSDSSHGALCHRSDTQYASQLLATAKNRDVRNIACSGAVMVDLISPQIGDDKGFKTSTGQLQMLAGADAPSAVFLTIGGNDIGFGDIATACLTAEDCSTIDSVRQEVERGLASLDQLPRYYTEISRVINTADKRAARGGAAAPVIVLPYLQALPPADRGTICESLSRNEIRFVDDVQRALNDAIARNVAVASGAGAEIYYASEVIRAAQPNHTACDSEPYIVPASKNSGAGALVLDWASSTLGGVAAGDDGAASATKAELLHPNIAGHGAIAAGLVAWSSAVKDRKSVGDLPATFQLSRFTSFEPSTTVDFTDATRPYSGVAGGIARVVVPVAEPVISGSVQSFCPLATCAAALWMHSEPRVLGRILIESGKPVDLLVAIPDDVPQGRHQLILKSIDADGRAHDVAMELRVTIPLPWWFWGVAGVAVVSLIVAVVALWRARRTS